MHDERPHPDELLARVQADEAQAARGKLKIFFGMAPGVGKTYAMLEAARKLAKEGVDVVVGYVEPHARPETQALVLGLEMLPRRAIPQGARTIWEFDLEAALKRKPQVLLVDELAHTNAEGSTHAKRWQDVEDLLAAGVNVYTTVNVQHLESLNDVVMRITSAPVRETVPDHVFEQADEVELVDLAPDDLIERLREGRVYVSAQAARAIENFFRKGNLIALRELALRKTADRVNSQALRYRHDNDVASIWPTSERLLVCVGPSPLSARLIRAARRMAGSLRAPWIALHVELERQPITQLDDRRRLEANLRLAEELGADVAIISGDQFAEAVLSYCREKNVTKIVVGKPLGGSWRDWLRGDFVSNLIRRSGDVDVYVINGDGRDDAPTRLRGAADRPAIRWSHYVAAAIVVALCTLVCMGLAEALQPTNLAMVYLACVVAVASWFGRGPSILATVLSIACFDLFFVPPEGTFAFSDARYFVTFCVMLATGLIVSELSSRVRAQSEAIRDRERRTAALYALSRELSNQSTREAAAVAAQRLIREAMGVAVHIILPDEDGRLTPVAASSANDERLALSTGDVGVVRWVWDHREAAGRGTDTLPGAAATYLPLVAVDHLVGVLGVAPHEGDEPLAVGQMQLLQAFTEQTAAALDRCLLAGQAEKIRLEMETERMRNSLLSAVSHDLRTPLTSIAGAASLLVENQTLDAPARLELAESIIDESDRLNRLVANLLDVTRLEAGAIKLHRELQPIEEVVEVVLQRMTRQLRGWKVHVELADDLPPVPIDGLLVQQVLINLLDNAVKFAPAGGVIDLHASRIGEGVEVAVLDRGPGLPAGEEGRVFEKFYRAAGQARTGSGVGLAVCRAVVELHGGRIFAENRPDGGAAFRFTLPLDPPHPSASASPAL